MHVGIPAQHFVFAIPKFAYKYMDGKAAIAFSVYSAFATVSSLQCVAIFLKYTIDKVQLIVPMYNKTTCILKMCNNNTEVIIN